MRISVLASSAHAVARVTMAAEMASLVNDLQGGFLLSLDLSEEDRFYDDKADVLEMNGLAESSSFTLRPNEEPPEQLLGFLRLLNLSGVFLISHHGLRYPCHGCPSLNGQSLSMNTAVWKTQAFPLPRPQHDVLYRGERPPVVPVAAVVSSLSEAAPSQIAGCRPGQLPAGGAVPERGLGPHAGTCERGQRARRVPVHAGGLPSCPGRVCLQLCDPLQDCACTVTHMF